MLKLDLSGKNAFVTGVADDAGFAWPIAKSLKAAGARVFLASHPRVVPLVERLLKRNLDAESRRLPYGVEGEFTADGVLGCDVEYDTMDDLPAEKREVKAYKEADVTIAGAMNRFRELSGQGSIDILIHAVAFTPEIQKGHLEVSRKAYLTAMSISSYSLVGLVRAALPLMSPGGAVVGLTYLAGERVVPTYGGGMAAAKAALECDARVLAHFAGGSGVRVNLISAGPYASRAAKAIGDINAMIEQTAAKSPLKRAITAQDVADTTLFLSSPLSGAITGELLHVDCGVHVMAP